MISRMSRRAGGDRIGRGVMYQIADAGEEFQNHVPDILPVGREHGHQGAQVQQHVEKFRDLQALHTQQVLGNGQMAGAGDGQKLRDALNQAQNHR